MYGNSPFDGNAAFSGGGFMPSQATQTPDPSFSPSTSKKSDSQPLIPLTVKQIAEALQTSDDKSNFLIDGVDINNVKLVGIMSNKAERVTDVSFQIDDGTGHIDCYRWVNEAVDTREMERVSNGIYVRVHGHLKGFMGKKQLMVYSVRPISNYNEIAYHFMECIFVHCYNTRLQKLQESAPTQAHMSVPAMNSAFGLSAQYNADGLKTLDKLILDYLQQPSCLAREKGVHRNELVQHLQVAPEKITEAIESLESEGLVYSTIDEFHYKSTTNG